MRLKEKQKAKGTLGICAQYSPEAGPIAAQEGGGGVIRARVDEDEKVFVFEYNATEVCVSRGKYAHVLCSWYA